MNKTEKITQLNTELMEEFVKTIGSYHFQLSLRSSLKIFLDLWNGEKPEDIEWEFKKNILDIKVSDVIDYHNFLNQSQKWCLRTKKVKFSHLKRFVKYILRKYSNKFDKIERLEFKSDLNDTESYKWDKKGHKQPNTYYKRLTMTKEEVLRILTYLNDEDYQKYLMFRILTESGCRKGELRSIDLERNLEGKIISIEQDLKNRCIRVIGKMGELKYIITKELAKQLLHYLHTIRLADQKNVKTNAFFVSQKGNRFSHAPLNYCLAGSKNKDGTTKIKGVLEKLGIKKHITPQTFRRTLNTLRYEMGCLVEDREVLLNHKSRKTNINYYTIHKDEQIIDLYDKWNPYKNLFNNLI